MFWSSLLEGTEDSEVFDLFLIVLSIVQLLQPPWHCSCLVCSYSSSSLWHASEVKLLPWPQRQLSWSEGSQLPKSLKNKTLQRKKMPDWLCWWFLEENLICNLWFGFVRSVCMDFIVVEMRHLATLANSSPTLREVSHLLSPDNSPAPKPFA